VRTAFQNAALRSDEVKEAARHRFTECLAAVDVAKQASDASAQAEGAAWANVLARDAMSDAGISRVRDEIYNALGRPRQSADFSQIFPDGIQPIQREIL
jgi:hypothetical protein